MDLQAALEQNVKFLLIEVDKQITRTGDYLQGPTPELARKIHTTDNYIDNLKSFIQAKCFSLAAQADSDDKTAIAQLQALETVALNLERVSDFCERVVDQVGHLQSEHILEEVDFQPFVAQVKAGVRELGVALDEVDLQAAFEVCRVEQEIDAQYAAMLRQILEALERGTHAQTQVTLLFIAHYFERMGDSLLNGGEALLSLRLGERIKIEQLRTLEDSLLDVHSELDNVVMHPVGETKSGARIARLTSRDGGQTSLIFKEGQASKLNDERDGIQRWQAIVPGIAPDIYSFQERGERSAILFEYLPGSTFEALLFRPSRSDLETALRRLTQTLTDVWSITRRAEPVRPRFMQQLLARLDDTRAVHPEAFSPAGHIQGVKLAAFADLVTGCLELDAELACPHSVLIHGDFNVDNVIYDDARDRVRFIDLHRSRNMDYCQDVSVFLVSNFRLQTFEAEFRRRVDWVMRNFLAWACSHAAQVGDAGFQMRLALGMARSYATSTRFVLQKSLVKEMLQKSRYILEVVGAHLGSDPSQFRFPEEVLLG